MIKRLAQAYVGICFLCVVGIAVGFALTALWEDFGWQGIAVVGAGILFIVALIIASGPPDGEDHYEF